MKKDKINVAVIGTGFGALIHIPAYSMHDKYNLIGVYGRNKKRASQIAKKYGIKVYNTKEEILHDSSVDMVSIASIVSEHFADAMMFVRDKKYIVLEKPMALTYEEACELKNLSKKYGTKTAICHEHKYDPSWRYVKKITDSQKYGKLRSIYFDYSFTYWNREHSSRAFDWFSLKEYGGGIIGGHLSHVLDLILYIDNMGIKDLDGTGFIEVAHHYDQNGVLQKQTAEDTVNASVLTNSGIPVYINLSAARFETYKKVTLHMEEAKIVIQGQNSITVFNDIGMVLEDTIPEEFEIKDYHDDFRLNSFLVFLDDFFQKYVEKGNSFITDFENGCVTQKLLDKVKVCGDR